MIRVEDVPIIEEGTLIRCVSGGMCFLFQYKERDYHNQTCTAIEGSVVRVKKSGGTVAGAWNTFPMGKCSVLSEAVLVDYKYFEIYDNSETV